MKKSKESYLTSAEVAEIIGVTRDYVRHMIHQKKIKAKKFGYMWLFRLEDIKHIKRQRFPQEKD